MELFGLHWLDFAALVSYLIVITGIGVYIHTKIKTASDFFMGGRLGSFTGRR